MRAQGKACSMPGGASPHLLVLRPPLQDTLAKASGHTIATTQSSCTWSCTVQGVYQGGFVGRWALTPSARCARVDCGLCRFCKSCFGNRKHRIPWRVIHRMDDKAYPVRGVAGCGSPHPMLPRLTRCGRRCQVADVVYPYLEVMCKAGVVDLIKYNRDRWGNDESWLDLVEIRKHLAAAKVGAHAGSDRSMGDGLLSAPPPPAVRDVPVPVSCDGAQLKAHPTQGVAKLEEVLPGADYMWRNTKMVSVNDIACVRASV